MTGDHIPDPALGEACTSNAATSATIGQVETALSRAEEAAKAFEVFKAASHHARYGTPEGSPEHEQAWAEYHRLWSAVLRPGAPSRLFVADAADLDGAMGTVEQILNRGRAVPRARWLVVGLGNPGPEYAGNRHNVGAMLVDRLHEGWGERWHPQPDGARADAVPPSEYHLHALVLARTASYMNESGPQVAALAQHLGIPAERLLVVHDDLDIPFGQVRLKAGGGEGGHNGLRSITEAVGTLDYCRLRIGIGRPPEGIPVIDHVLSDFTADELAALPLEAAEAAVRAIAADGWVPARNTVNAGTRLAPGARRAARRLTAIPAGTEND